MSKSVSKVSPHTTRQVELDQHIVDRQAAFYRALCASGGDVVGTGRKLGLSYRIASSWARKTAFHSWREALLAEVAESVAGRLPRVYEQVFQNAYGDALPVIEAAVSDEPVEAMKGLTEAQKGQIQDFTVVVDGEGRKTVKVKLANRDRSNEMALAILGVDKDKAAKGDRPVFTVNVMVAGDSPKTVEAVPVTTMLA